jgi:predicted GNAT superfamily acetyltransferase
MAHDDEVYDEARIEALRDMLRDLARRILELDRSERLLLNVPELLRRMGDLRSELFHYEVRATYDSPEVAEHRRLVDEARTTPDFPGPDLPDPEDDEPWRPPRPE